MENIFSRIFKYQRIRSSVFNWDQALFQKTKNNAIFQSLTRRKDGEEDTDGVIICQSVVPFCRAILTILTCHSDD
jgi:hypothetical protein